MNDRDFNQKEKYKSDQMRMVPTEDAEQIESLGATIAEDEKPDLGTMKIDLHCHTEASHDSSTPLGLIPNRCLNREVSVQAITDHDQIWGAKKLKSMVEDNKEAEWHNLTVIVGQEISTSEGEIIGLFLHEAVPPGLSPEQTVEHIQNQGGLVLIPHGFDPMKRWRLRPEALERIAGAVDIIETFNARVSNIQWNQAAVAWSQERGVLMSAGSDAHTLAEIGSAWVEVPRRTIQEPQDLMDALRGGKPVGDWTHPVVAYVYKVWDRTMRKLKARR
jgi:predicted metal-dependent phosphoesterase TrpH